MNPLLEWQEEVENDPVVIEPTPAGIGVESQKNQWSFSLTQEQAQELDQAEVLHFLQGVMLARERQIIERFGGRNPMVFYCWFDEQASQLRFSLVSAFHNRLPFGGRVEVAAGLALVVQRFLQSSYHSGIPLEEFTEESGANAEFVRPSVLVWSEQIPAPSPNR